VLASSSAGRASRPTSTNPIKEAKLGLVLDKLPVRIFNANWPTFSWR
jgi:hypothetical protein